VLVLDSSGPPLLLRRSGYEQPLVWTSIPAGSTHNLRQGNWAACLANQFWTAWRSRPNAADIGPAWCPLIRPRPRNLWLSRNAQTGTGEPDTRTWPGTANTEPADQPGWNSHPRQTGGRGSTAFLSWPIKRGPPEAGVNRLQWTCGLVETAPSQECRYGG